MDHSGAGIDNSPRPRKPPSVRAQGMLKQVVVAFVLAAVGYALLYTFIEHWRTRNGAWEVTFTNTVSGQPLVLIDQPGIRLSRVRIELPSSAAFTNSGTRLVFDQPKRVPFAVPFGECVFMDLTSLPGTVVLKLGSHEVELLPRVLVIDKQERAWVSGGVVRLE